MARRTGQKTRHPRASTPSGWGWQEYLAALVEEHGTLAALAWKLFEPGAGPEEVASIERALRRLRDRGTREGGVWGQRLLRRFGVPRAIEERLRWMGLYHSPFNDLPIAICQDQLRLWNQGPIAASRARVWLQLGAASVALRRREFDEARRQLEAAAATLSGPDEARDPAALVELPLARAYLESRTGTSADVLAWLARAELALGGSELLPADRVCFAARLADQRAFQHNRARNPGAAFELFRALPAEDVHPFASYRREAGLAYGHLRQGEHAAARRHALAACEHAGDGGYTRLRVMALLLIARIDGLPAAAGPLARAGGIAERLDDEELTLRVERARRELSQHDPAVAAPRDAARV